MITFIGDLNIATEKVKKNKIEKSTTQHTHTHGKYKEEKARRNFY